MKLTKEHYNAASLGRATGFSKAWIAELCQRGAIKAERFGRSWLIKKEAAQEWLDSREPDGEDSTAETSH